MEDALTKIQKICDDSSGRSQVFLPRSQGHLNAIKHFYESSSQDAIFAVEPGSADDLSEIMKVIKDKRVDFAVKGGGHTSNPGFSSTTGIQISLSRLNEISLDDDDLTVGAGCLFDEIYRYILPKNRNIVGGGGSVGIGGWILEGGYSLKTNEHGLGIDNLVEAEIVLPNGDKVDANEETNSDLFWAIKGGGNNFGIATKFVLKTHKQNEKVYGGLLTFDKPRVGRVKKAIVDFINKDTAEATIVAAFRAYRNHGIHEFKLTVLASYDNEKPDPDPFKDFLDIPHDGELTELTYPKASSGSSESSGSSSPVLASLKHTPTSILSSYRLPEHTSTLLYAHVPANVAISLSNPNTTSLYNPPSHFYAASNPILGAPYRIQKSPDIAINNAPRPFPSGLAGLGVMSGRARWGNVMVSTYTADLIDVIEEEVKAAKRLMEKYNGRMAVADIWPFRETMVPKSKDSAWPHTERNGPLLVYFMWEGSENDDVWIGQMKTAIDHIRRIAIREKCTTSTAPVYCNTTLETITKPEEIYRDNFDDLCELRSKFDPDEVMSRTGGFRIPPRPAFVNEDYKITNALGVNEFRNGSIFHIEEASSLNTDEYIISVKNGGNTAELVNASKIDFTTKPREASTWKLIPKSRARKQLCYWIENVEGTKHWVLRDEEVKLEDADEPEALWRFTRA